MRNFEKSKLFVVTAGVKGTTIAGCRVFDNRVAFSSYIKSRSWVLWLSKLVSLRDEYWFESRKPRLESTTNDSKDSDGIYGVWFSGSEGS